MSKIKCWVPVAAAAMLVLAGCAGQQYVPPPDGAAGVATATFRPASRMNSSLQVMQFDKRGCYQGHTDVAREGSHAPLRMVPGQERFFTMRAQSTRDVCSVVVSFTPEPNARYRLVELKDFPNGVLGVQTCGIRIERDSGDAAPFSIDAREWSMRQAGMKCFRAVPWGGSLR